MYRNNGVFGDVEAVEIIHLLQDIELLVAGLKIRNLKYRN